MSRFVRPETVRLDISNGDWLLVKKRLNAGEQRQVYARLMKPVTGTLAGGASQTFELDPVKATLSNILGYLLDWSLTDDEGKPVVIRGKSETEIIAALDALEGESFAEIQRAIADHETAVADARRAAEAVPFGESESSVT